MRKGHRIYESPEALATRFWSKVAKGDGCWEWQASRMATGYGAFGYLGKVVTAHRMSWILAHGEVAGDAHVCHHCDNRPCVRPDHLFLGTASDNIRDMARKGRNRVKLTNESVVSILNRYDAKEATQRQLAREYGVTQAMISYLVQQDRKKEGPRWQYRNVS